MNVSRCSKTPLDCGSRCTLSSCSCGRERSSLTVDHVIPRSKGGSSGWDNIVTCCAPCNRRKGDRLPRQANMVPRHVPRAPSSTIFIHVATPVIPRAWEQYLAA